MCIDLPVQILKLFKLRERLFFIFADRFCNHLIARLLYRSFQKLRGVSHITTVFSEVVRICFKSVICNTVRMILQSSRQTKMGLKNFLRCRVLLVEELLYQLR